MTGETTSQFIRRKFTITESLDSVLVKMADRHYHGNVSLCLRAAIESHRSLLRGEGQFAAHRAARALEQLDEQQAELNTMVESLSGKLTEETPAVSEGVETHGVTLPPEAAVVYEELMMAEATLRIEDIMERLEMGPAAVLPGLATLVDRGLVVPQGSEKQRYRLAGYGGRA